MAWVAFLVVALVSVVVILAVLRSGRMREKYAALWLIVSLAIVVVTVWPGLLSWVASVLGVQLPSNLLFFVAILMLLGVTLHLSLEVSKLEDETRTLSEEVAMLDERLRRLERRPHPHTPQASETPEVDGP